MMGVIGLMGIDEGEDVFFGVGVKPMDRSVASEPRHLFAGVDAGVLLDFLHRKVQRTLATKVGKEFLVTHGVEGVGDGGGGGNVLVVEFAGFIQQAVGHHLFDTGVDTGIEFLAGTGKANLQHRKRTGGAAAGAE